MKPANKIIALILSISLVVAGQSTIVSAVSNTKGSVEVSDTIMLRGTNQQCISSVTIESNVASVSLSTAENCKVVVAVYDSSGSQLLDYASMDVQAGSTQAQIPLNISNLPEDCCIKAFMLQPVSLRPLCGAYSSREGVGESRVNGDSASLPANTRLALVVKDAYGDLLSGVTLKGAFGETLVTDQNGFASGVIANGEYTITAEKSGYTTSTIMVNADGNTKYSVITMSGNNDAIEHKRYIEDKPWYADPQGQVVGGECGTNATWSLDPSTGVLTISGTGTMTDYGDVSPWYDYNHIIKSIVIESGITSIGNKAFKDSVNATNVTLADTITKIGSEAFKDSGITKIEIPASVKTIGTDAFLGCEELKTVENKGSLQIEKGNTSYGYVAYYADEVIDVSEDDGWTPIFKGSANIEMVPKGDSNAVSRVYYDLKNNEQYTLYALKSMDGDIFAKENIMYIDQTVSNDKGEATFTSVEFADRNVTAFVMSENGIDISEATATIPYIVTAKDKASVVHFKLELDGNELVEGRDYYLTGDCLADKSGTYSFTVNGVGKYCGSKELSFTAIETDGSVKKDGYVFKGWYESADAGANPANVDITSPDGLYAVPQWIKIPSITLDSSDIYMGYGELNRSASGFALIGAQIRYNKQDNKNGLRFVSRVSAELIDELDALDGNKGDTSFGHILSSKINENSVLDETNGSKLEAAGLLYNGESYKTFSAVVIGIPEANYNTEISTRTYIEYTDANGNHRMHLFTEKESRNYNGAYHTTIARVAKFIVDYDATRLNNSTQELQEYIRMLASKCTD
ncbi:MAG: leucine-rich repeat protein [Clostridia bacterium]|nr:leucine-rich repeat protein [Clostridia bacterium]